MATRTWIGKDVPRLEDPRLLTGRANYTDDVRLPGMAHAAVLRSPQAHARLGKVDLGPALRQPGVVAAFSGADVPLSLPTFAVLNPDKPPPARPALARDKVRYVGEAVVVVFAEDRYVARDAAELVEVAYEPLPAAASLRAAQATGAPLIHDDYPGNVYVRLPRALAVAGHPLLDGLVG